MRNKLQPALLLIVIFCWFGDAGVTVNAATGSPVPIPSPTPESLDTIRIGQCGTTKNLEAWIEAETSRGSVIDARPFTINQVTGKLSFHGSTGRVSVVNMNPFVYNYKITVAQKEIVSTAVSDFLKLLFPEALRSIVGPQSGGDNLTASRVTPNTKLGLIAERLKDFKASNCGSAAESATAQCIAVNTMYSVFTEIEKRALIKESGKSELSFTIESPDGTRSLVAITPSKIELRTTKAREPVNRAFAVYTKDVNDLRDEEADAQKVCGLAQKLNDKLGEFEYKEYFDQLDLAEKAIAEVNVLARDLEDLATAFSADEDLKNGGKSIRCKGFNCVAQFNAYAQEVRNITGTYSAELGKLREKVDEMQKMHLLTEQMKSKDGLFARTFTIMRKFEMSQATVSVKRERIRKEEADKNAKGTQSGNQTKFTGGESPQPVVSGNEPSEGTARTDLGGNNFMARGTQAGAPTTDELPPATGSVNGKSDNPAPAGQITETVQIGRPRFMLSGGLVYSPLPRRTFKSVKGFVLDAQGNPTGNGGADVVAFDQNSSRRLLPMVLLNSRLLSFESASLFFSFGVSAKHDDNLDIEYLFGPSVSLLNDRALFTFGVYGGKTQNLVSDLKIGDELPDDVGDDAKLFRKSYTWKPGFSFSYSFSRPPKDDTAGVGTGTAASSTADDLRNEFHIGSIPFNLAVGLAYTSLEQRGYDAIVGYARDRQGNLTGGQVLTRIVGLSSSSNYRLTPLALLHSRLTDFGGHDFYLSTGITGKKTNTTFDIEYLLGGSVNLYGRKVFVTFGTFAGKQQLLGGDFFEGAKLSASQPVTTQNRYVWKPAFAISYDITRIIPGK